MKYLLVLGIALVVIWLWRSGRNSKTEARPVAPAPPPALEDMVRCADCAVHLPQADAVRGRKAWYCSDGHRQRSEG